jgi:NADH-quinone oxidoreductase subunit N
MDSPMTPFMLSFLPELVLLAGALLLFIASLGKNAASHGRSLATSISIALFAACLMAFNAKATLFTGAYRVDAYSQFLKLVLAAGYLLVNLLNRDLGDIRDDIRGEYHFFLSLSLTGLIFLVSSIDIISIVVSLELSSYPLFLMVAMRREQSVQRVQMESAIKYMMFGISATGVMLFGLSFLYGLTGTTALPAMATKLQPLLSTPLAIVGLAMTFAGFFYKLAVFPFHFWTPDVYEGASNETAGLVASLPKVGATAVLVRFVYLSTPAVLTRATDLALLLAILATASMFYGNLLALVQKDVKRLLGFSGIAHAGYALVGFVAMDRVGYTASLFYITGYLVMVLAAFLVVSRVSQNGANVAIEDLAGLHKRSPLLAATLGLAVFALAGLPPFVGFMGKFGIINAALARGWLWLAVVMVINSAVAAYYYLRIVKEMYFSDPEGQASKVVLDPPALLASVLLVALVVGLGVAPAGVMERISDSLLALGIGQR